MSKPMGLPFGPYPLTAIGVVQNVLLNSPGAYALGELRADGIFYIDYVGRSDDDLANRLGQQAWQSSPQFFFAYCSSAEAAYLKECQLYHDFTPPKNLVHPAKPAGLNRRCPVCLG